MDLAAWTAAAIADAERRGLPGLRPLIETLAEGTRALRASDLPQQERVRGPNLPAAATGDPRP